MIWLTIGVLLISFVTTHAWWTVVRVVCLRLDIFDSRDRLFDVAMATDRFDDPAYRDARCHLNSVARIADSITLPMLGYLLHADLGTRERKRSENPILQEAIDETLEDCTSSFGNGFGCGLFLQLQNR